MHGATVKIVWFVVIVSVDVRRSWETAMAKCTLRQASGAADGACENEQLRTDLVLSVR